MVQHSCFNKGGDSASSIFGIRHLQCFLLFWGIALTYATRVNFSLAVVAMTDKKSANEDFVEYHWSEKIISLILSSFFWGYMATQLPGGFLARRFGGKSSIFISIFGTSFFAMLTPLAAQLGDWYLVCALRVLQGMCQGMLFPATHDLLAHWAPVEERTVLGTYCYSGVQFGTVVMLFSSGFIAASPLGWPGIFYISGGLGCLWTISWYYWGASSPSDYKNISLAEKQLIEASLSKGKEAETTGKQNFKTPWLEILSSPPFLALTIVQCAYSWVSWTILTEIPFYMKGILGFKIQSNAALTALPYLVMFILNFAFTGLGAYVENKKWLTLTQSRKFFNTIAMWLPAIALIGLGYINKDQSYLAVILLVIAVGLTAAMCVGLQVNHIDLSPNFAGMTLAITNVIANIMSTFSPLAVGFIVTDEENILQWRLVFYIAAGIAFIGNLLFIIFGTAKVQTWNEPNQTKKNCTNVDLS